MDPHLLRQILLEHFVACQARCNPRYVVLELVPALHGARSSPLRILNRLVSSPHLYFVRGPAGCQETGHLVIRALISVGLTPPVATPTMEMHDSCRPMSIAPGLLGRAPPADEARSNGGTR